MRAWTVFFSLSILLSGCASDEETMKGPRLYISGDMKSVGAETYIDGEKVGVMERRVYTGPDPSEEAIKKHQEAQRQLGIKATRPLRKGDAFAIGVDVRIKRGEKKPEYGLYADIRGPRGKHEILFISEEGKRLGKQVDMKDETYIAVNFQDFVIQGGD